MDPVQEATAEETPALEVGAELVDPSQEASAEDGTSEQQEDSDEQPRDAQGRFMPKFSSWQEAEKAWDNANRELGSHGQRMGDLQRELSDLKQGLSRPQLTEETVSWFDAEAEQNPHAAAVWALQNDPSGALYNRAMETWFDTSPREASAFERRLEMAEFQQQFVQQQQPLYEQAARNDLSQAWSAVRQQIPDLDNYTDAILEVAKESPEIISGLQDGSSEAKQRVIRNLYKQAKFDSLYQANQLPGAEQQTAPTAAQERQQAFVASGSQYRDPERKDPNDAWFEANVLPHLNFREER